MEYPKFKVCVRCFTFNQAKYIEETMNGFVMQQTDFPFVCCIVDDASTDGEQEVIKKYMDMHFDYSPNSVSFEKETDYAYIHYAQHKENKNCYFAVLLLKENLYSSDKSNLKFNYIAEWYEKCQYEAICEGDDYWIDSRKLQKQVDILDKNSDVGLVYSKAEAFTQKGIKFFVGRKVLDFYDLVKDNNIPTVTVCLRKSIAKEYSEVVCPETQKWLMGDYPKWLWFSFKSQLLFLDEVTSKYRILQQSGSHFSNIDKMLSFKDSYYDIKKYFVCSFFNSDKKMLKYIEQQRLFAKFKQCIILDQDVRGFYMVDSSPIILSLKHFFIVKIMKYSNFFRNLIKKRWLKETSI